MWAWRQLSANLVLVPIVALLAVGLFLSLRSGVADMSRRQDLRVLALNFTSVLLRVAGYVAGMCAVHYMIGAPLALGR